MVFCDGCAECMCFQCIEMRGDANNGCADCNKHAREHLRNRIQTSNPGMDALRQAINSGSIALKQASQF